VQHLQHKKFRFTPMQILAIGFAVVILIGAFLLKLPISSSDGSSTPLIDCLFTSTSAVCVTGLVTVDTGTHWSYFGKTVIMLLIETGGLGFMTMAALMSLLLGRRITLRDRLIMQESMNSSSLQGIVRMVRYVLIFTFTIEGICALLLATQFVPRFGALKGAYYSIFHSVSAFCNAGFDILGTAGSEYVSLTQKGYYNNSVIILTIGFLIVAGGLGFGVWYELYKERNIKNLSLHSKVVLTVTAILVFGGALLMFIFEMNNPGTMKDMALKDKALSSLFASITPRTAGFNSISTADMSPAGRFLTIILMFIGGSPGSTAGGIKTATFGLLVITVVSIVRGREDAEVFKKRIGKDTVYKALVITIISLTLVMVVTMMLSITEVGASLEYILYEATSAFATVGLTLGLTTKLTALGKLIITFTMYCGRVGPLTIACALASKTRKDSIKYPEDRILVG